MKKRPKVSIIMPVYNGDKYLRGAIKSIISQTFQSFEFIIINDGSTDNTNSILAEFSDPRIKLLTHESNKGIVKSLNDGIARAKGKYLARMDADDISTPDRLAKQVAFLDRHQDVDILGTWIKIIGKQSYVVRFPLADNEIKYQFLFRCAIAHPSAMMRLNQLTKSMLQYDQSFTYSEDYALWVSLIEKMKFWNISETLLLHREHPQQISKTKRQIQLKMLTQIQNLLLKKIGVKKPNMTTHKYLREECPNLNRQQLNDTYAWISSLNRANTITNIVDRTYLLNNLTKKWLRLVIGSTTLTRRQKINTILNRLSLLQAAYLYMRK